jgi:uncharacterized protein involved in exopolysaccharide biosynthesis
LAEEISVSLSRKLDEARIAAQEEKRAFRVGSHAAVPPRPSGSRGITNTLVVGLVGGAIGLGVVVAREWWKADGGHSGVGVGGQAGRSSAGVQ